MLTLSGYTLDGLLHRGRETVIYRATRASDGLPVAIKVSARDIPTPRDRARLRYEFELLGEIAQPGIVHAVALESSNLGLALVLERLPGVPLDEYLASKKPGLRESLEIAIAITSALASVHGRRVVHKDLKPHHLFYEAESGRVSILDFGIATRLGHIAAEFGSPSGLEGTLAYLSPEQTGRVNISVDRRSDLYSLGVLLYELFTGVLPFSSIDPMELLYCHVARRPLAPHARNPQLPVAVSAIIMKLLAKTPEERYQSALGLRADLLQCVHHLQHGGRIPDAISLGTRDFPYELQLSRKLYGRERERGELLRIFEQVKEGGTGLALISGYSGVGKTALVAELHKALMQHGGLYAAGKFDQLNRHTPYSSLAHALRELVQQILAQGQETVARWKDRLTQSLGLSASSLTMMVPELQSLLGPIADAASLGPAEAQNRFDIAVDALIRAFCHGGQPLILLLDDLQWADPASLRLLQVLFGQGAPRGLLVVGAYRDNEVDVTHPLRMTIASLLRDGAPVHEIRLGPLGFDSLQTLLSDTLKLPETEVEPLARCVFDKTQGNPFFVGQFLSALYRDALLIFSAENERWEWNLAQIQQRAVTDNVIDFMSERLKLLSAPAQQVVMLAACIGHEFDLRTLSVISERSTESVAQLLGEALRDGVIQPLLSEQRYAEQMEYGPLGGAKQSYRFVHDRIHEAAYALIADADRMAVRLRIGRLLLAQFQAETSVPADGSSLYSVANHLNQGRSLMVDSAERHALAVLNRHAGNRARSGAAFPTASEYYRIGLELLDAEADRADPELRLALLAGFAESESLCGRFEVAESCFERIDALAETVLARAQATCLRLKLYQVAGRYREGVALAERSLRTLGIVLPGSPDEANAAIGAEVADIPRNLGGRQIEELLDAPLATDPHIQVAIELLVNAAPCAYIGQPEAFPYIALKMLNLSLQHGNTPASCFAYSVYGFMLVAAFGDTPSGYRYSEMSIRLNEKLNDISLRGTLLHLHGDHINFWVNHIRTDRPILERAFIACQQAGDYVYANYLAFETVWQIFEIGDPLEDTLRESEQFARFSRKTRNEAVYQTIRLEQQFFRCLMGKTEHGLVLAESGFDVAENQRIIAEASFGCGVAFGHIIELLLSFFRGDLPGARAAIAAVIPHQGAVMAMPIEATFHFFRALTLARSLSDGEQVASDAERDEWQTTLNADLERLSRWAAVCPETFEAKYRTARAESLRARGDILAALTEYDAAIGAAEASGFIHYAALACELAGRCLLSVKRPRPAAMYLTLALRHLQRWGATALANQVIALLDPIRHLIQMVTVSDEQRKEIPDARGSTSEEVTERLLDVTTVLKAAQAIASEIEMGRLLEQVMGIVLTNSGAQRGVLVIPSNQESGPSRAPGVSGSELQIVAIAAIEPDEVRVGLSIPVDTSSPEVAASIVRFVAHTRETLILSNPLEDSRFAADSYLQQHKPRSLMCMPLLHQNKLSGVMYLENGIVRDVFSRERVELLRLLCAQVSIALENARLYERVRASASAIHEANARLEAEVNTRTAELHEANSRLLRRGQELDDINQRLQHELEDRQRTEQERLELQERIIRTQQARLAEMATPLIPISSEIVVMPLIGTVDDERANQVLETALHGVQESQAHFVILDITGLRHVDTSVAGTLVKTARALQLVGATAIITGVRAEVAQTLVSLGIDLERIVCLSRLQGGIAYAQKQLQKR